LGNTADPDIPFADGRLLIVFGWNIECWGKER
jgi:hypothetical protein